MEPLFPDLLFLGPFFAPLIIRAGLVCMFVWNGALLVKKHGAREKARGVWSLLLAGLFAAGVFTQLAALIGIAYLAVLIFLSKETGSPLKHRGVVFLVVCMLLSLIVTGAGYTPFPFGDLPY